MCSEMEFAAPAAMQLGEFIREVCNGDKQMLFKMMDERGELRPHVAIFVGSEHCKYLDGLETEISPDDEVSVFPALSGG